MSSMRKQGVDERALARIEEVILPSIALTLDALLEAASRSPRQGDAVQSAELRAIAGQLAATVRQLEAVTIPVQPRPEWPLRISA